jgi:hypothetical protein
MSLVRPYTIPSSLRDGSVLNGDVESVSATEVVVRTGGTMHHLNRNQVKRILLVERDPAPSEMPPPKKLMVDSARWG